MVIGLANIIPGVSGGTMMVSMGIYDKLIHCITHLFKEFKRSILTLLPYAVGMVVAIALGAFGLKYLFAEYPLPTNALFIGLILGSLPIILKELKGEKTGWQGILAFVLLFGLVVGLKLVEANNKATVDLNIGTVLLMFVLGAICSAAMVIPGVSGSMILKTLGFYEPVVTEAIPAAIKGITGGDWGAVLHNLGILLPFLLGIVFGIFGIAKLISVLMKKWKGRTYCGILGMVLASPVVILLDKNNWNIVEKTGEITGPRETTVWIILISVVTLAIGAVVALKLGGDPEPAKE